MAKVFVTKVVEVKLTLSEYEAKWLRANLQNPLHGQDYVEEPQEDSDIRHSIFEALDGVELL